MRPLCSWFKATEVGLLKLVCTVCICMGGSRRGEGGDGEACASMCGVRMYVQLTPMIALVSTLRLVYNLSV